MYTWEKGYLFKIIHPISNDCINTNIYIFSCRVMYMHDTLNLVNGTYGMFYESFSWSYEQHRLSIAGPGLSECLDI